MKIRQTKYIIGFAFILLGIGIVVATTLPKSFKYYVTVDELMAHERKFAGHELKVAGKVKDGTVQQSEKDLLTRFDMINEGRTVAVTYRGPLPDTFKEGVDVVVTGTFDTSGHINANHVLAKCASRYEEKLTPGYQTP